MEHVSFRHVDEMWEDMLRRCKGGARSAPRGMGTKEIIGYTGTVTNPAARILQCPGGTRRRGYAAASVGWNLMQRQDVDSICWWNPNGRKISDDGTVFLGANYGMRFDPYLAEAMNVLRHDTHSRRAWVPIWMPTDMLNPAMESFHGRGSYSIWGRDVPCTIGFGLKIDTPNEESGPILDMHVVMRSQSAYGVFPYDWYLFSVLHELIANQLGTRPGWITWHCMSLHVYDREEEQVDQALTWYRRQRRFGVEDKPIRITYGQAQHAYGVAFELMTGKPQELLEAPVQRHIGSYGGLLDDDPVIFQMLQGHQEAFEENRTAGVAT